MNNKSLLNTNAYLKRDSHTGKFLDRNIASNTAVETKESVAVVNAKILKLRAEKPAKLLKKPA